MTPAKYARAIFDAIALPINIARVWLRARGSDATILHNGRFKAIPPGVLIPIFCRANRGRLSKPPNLTILLVHNRPTKTLVELSLDYVGIDNYTVLRLPANERWRHTARITAVLDFLRSGRCETEYILCCDCDDVLVRGEPARAIEFLHAAGCEMLVSSTAYARYRNMPEVKARMIAIAPDDLRNRRGARIHLNAGVFVARAAFLKEYMEEAMTYVTENDVPSRLLTNMSDAEVLARLPDFPRGIGSDQTIMRYLFPRFHPRMKIDYSGQLALR